jgi:large subunit ribosomal protein L19
MANSFLFQNETYNSGDTVRLHLAVNEGDKTRTQIFEGIIISIKGEGPGKSITVRKIASGGIGVEKVMPLGSPTLQKIERKFEGQVRRAKLYYLRDRIGRQATKVKTKSKDAVKAAPKASAPSDGVETKAESAVEVKSEQKADRKPRRTTSKKTTAK